ncbi:MAG: PLP-dependent aminotransferase family protein [bacterium]|nr:PLP-dependent aminotransferase family protein [bacterium]
MIDLQIERSGDRGVGVPVYLQIAGQIRDRVVAGALAPGDRLPPIRELAKNLGVNRDTVSTAYETLAAEGVIDARVGRGTFVRGLRPRTGKPTLPVETRLAVVTQRLLDHERARVAYGDTGNAIQLQALKPDPSLFPVEAFRRALNRTFMTQGPELLDYGDPRGDPGLRGAVAERLRAVGTRVHGDQIVLCQGASQAISLGLRLFADAGDTVAVEEPTYQNALAAAIGLGIQVVPVPMRKDGADLDALDRSLSRPEVKLFYTIPTFHNPMGTTTDLVHRKELLDIASRHGKPVLEDAYEMDLRFTGRPVPSLMALDEEGLVVQLLSFSKSLFPGLRCGAVVGRRRHVDGLLALRHAADLGGALPLQAALADFLRSGAYDRHLATLRRKLRERRDALMESLEAEMPEGTQWQRPEGGYQVWVELPVPLDTRELFADALRAGVLIAPGFQFLHDGRASRGMRLSIGLSNSGEIRRGIALLGALVRERLGARNAHRAQVHV